MVNIAAIRHGLVRLRSAVRRGIIHFVRLPLILRDKRLIAKVRRKKQTARASGLKYRERPGLSAVLLSFNHKRNVCRIIQSLKQGPVDEIILCEDGSVDGTLQAAKRMLTGPNDFIICSNDIHEIRAYNRAADYARGEILMLLQDDDIPQAGDWITEALELFAADGKLGILGGARGFRMDADRAPNPHRVIESKKLPWREAGGRIPFVYVDGVDLAPMFVRREVFQSLGGFLTEFSDAGEAAGGWLDIELSLRAWLHGWRVALYRTPFERWVGGQGTKKYGGAQIRYRNHDRNRELTLEMYADSFGRISDSVDAANGEIDPELVRLVNKVVESGKNRGSGRRLTRATRQPAEQPSAK